MSKKVYKNVAELIGNTPLMEVTGLEKEYQLEATVLVKLEYLNPTGSVKDRAAKNMIADAEQRGVLKPGATIIEPTSGNTGIGLAALAASKGYSLILTMPETMSVERRNILKAYGAQIVLTDGAKGMAGAIAKAGELAKEIPGSFLTGQFDNPANSQAHFLTTGPEIWEDTDGQVDILVASVGTGGTITGTGEYLKSKNSNIKVIAVEPSDSPVLSGGAPGPHGIQGIGAGFVPTVLNTNIYDEVIPVETQAAFDTAKLFAHKEGILVGISAGAALYAAIEAAKKKKTKARPLWYFCRIVGIGIIHPIVSGIKLVFVLLLFEEGKYGKNKDRTKRRNKVMKEIKICFTNPDDVKEFVRAARKCEFDIDLTYQRAVVDAKSSHWVFLHWGLSALW